MDQHLFVDPEKTFLDPSCGDGQFLASVLYRKLQNNIDFETALSAIYGVDLMPDNVELCRERLLCDRTDLKHIVEQNIVCADGLIYHYRFDGSHPYDDEIAEQQEREIFNSLFEF
jgi:SAM-dependent methyltransferase